MPASSRAATRTVRRLVGSVPTRAKVPLISWSGLPSSTAVTWGGPASSIIKGSPSSTYWATMSRSMLLKKLTARCSASAAHSSSPSCQRLRVAPPWAGAAGGRWVQTPKMRSPKTRLLKMYS